MENKLRIQDFLERLPLRQIYNRPGSMKSKSVTDVPVEIVSYFPE